MAPKPNLYLTLLMSFTLLGAATAIGPQWNIINLFRPFKSSTLKISLSNYCESWRYNVELNNIRGFDVVPAECAGDITDYLTSAQYLSDVQTAIEECTLYLNQHLLVKDDGKDALVFDVDEVLLSTAQFYQNNGFKKEKIAATMLEKWMQEAKAPAIEHVLSLYKHLKAKGVKIFLISSREEYLRNATVENLIAVGYHGWSGLFFRSDNSKSLGQYKAGVRGKLVADGYRIWAVIGSQWSSLYGEPSPLRIFKLPNPMYYES